MTPLPPSESLDRHALVMAIWFALGLVATALFHHGLGAGAPGFTASGFGVVLVAFVGHVIVNAVYRATFTARELALGLVIYAAGLVAFGLAVLIADDLDPDNIVIIGLGFLALFLGVGFYMVTHFGMRRVFDAFDVIRDFRPENGDGREGERP